MSAGLAVWLGFAALVLLALGATAVQGPWRWCTPGFQVLGNLFALAAVAAFVWSLT